MNTFAVCVLLLAQVDISEHLAMGNPSAATEPQAGDRLNNALLLKPEYAASYNEPIGTPNWVSWRCSKEWIGAVERANDFRTDDSLPATWYRAKPGHYVATGFDRGHVCPAADRSKDAATSSQTFLMTNMMPQAPQINRHTWMLLESHCRDLVKSGKELYVIAGPAGCGGFGSKGYRERLDEHIVVPSACWKVVVVLPDDEHGDAGDAERVTAETKTLAVIMPNSQDVGDDWKKYRVTIRAIEEVTGYDFLTALRPSIQDAIETIINDEE